MGIYAVLKTPMVGRPDVFWHTRLDYTGAKPQRSNCTGHKMYWVYDKKPSKYFVMSAEKNNKALTLHLKSYSSEFFFFFICYVMKYKMYKLCI